MMKSALIRTSVTILGTIGLLAAPAVAHARPPLPLGPRCAGTWGFDGGSIIREPDTGWTVTFFSNGQQATGDATASNNRGGMTAAATPSPSTMTTVNTSCTRAG